MTFTQIPLRSCLLCALLWGGGQAVLADVLYTVTDLGNFGGIYMSGGPATVARGMNNAGQVTGFSYSPNGTGAFLYSNGQLQNLNTLPWGASYGQGINDAGQVMGYSNSSTGAMHAFLYSNGQMMDLGTLGYDSHGYGINNAGQVTGSAFTGDDHAFIYSNGQMMDLNQLIEPTLGITLGVGVDINDKGQIVAIGTTIPSAGSHTYLLSPTAAPAPEPGTWALFSLAFSVLLIRVRRRHPRFVCGAAGQDKF